MQTWVPVPASLSRNVAVDKVQVQRKKTSSVENRVQIRLTQLSKLPSNSKVRSQPRRTKEPRITRVPKLSLTRSTERIMVNSTMTAMTTKVLESLSALKITKKLLTRAIKVLKNLEMQLKILADKMKTKIR